MEKDNEQAVELILDFIHKQIKKNSYIEKNGNVVLGNLIELHFSEGNEYVDVYKYVPQEVIEADKDYDFDEDFLTSIYLK